MKEKIGEWTIESRLARTEVLVCVSKGGDFAARTTSIDRINYMNADRFQQDFEQLISDARDWVYLAQEAERVAAGE